MAEITLRLQKGAPLTIAEVDANFSNLDQFKIEATSNTGSAILPVGTENERDEAPEPGYIRFNSESLQFEGFNGTEWTTVGSAALDISDLPPDDPQDGSLWWNSVTGNLKIYYVDDDSGQWVDAFVGTPGPRGDVGPQGASGPLGLTGATGPAGPTGATGASGPLGLTGATGPTGGAGATGAAGPFGPKAVTLSFPSTGDTKVVLFYTTAQLTLQSIAAVLPGGASTPTVSYNVRWGSNISLSGTAVTSSANTVTSTTTATTITSFSNGTISANSFVWVEVTNVGGTVPLFSLTLNF